MSRPRHRVPALSRYLVLPILTPGSRAAGAAAQAPLGLNARPATVCSARSLGWSGSGLTTPCGVLFSHPTHLRSMNDAIAILSPARPARTTFACSNGGPCSAAAFRPYARRAVAATPGASPDRRGGGRRAARAFGCPHPLVALLGSQLSAGHRLQALRAPERAPTRGSLPGARCNRGGCRNCLGSSMSSSQRPTAKSVTSRHVS